MMVFNTKKLWSADLVLQILGAENYLAWASHEEQAITEFLKCAWQYILEDFPKIHCIAACNFIEHVPEPQIYLDEWEQRLNETAALRHLAEFISMRYCVLTLGYKSIGVSPIHDAWVIRDSIREILEDAFFRYSNSNFAQEFSDAVEHLKWIQWYK